MYYTFNNYWIRKSQTRFLTKIVGKVWKKKYEPYVLYVIIIYKVRLTHAHSRTCLWIISGLECLSTFHRTTLPTNTSLVAVNLITRLCFRFILYFFAFPLYPLRFRECVFIDVTVTG